MTDSNSQPNQISGVRGVIELLERSPETIEHVYVRKDRQSPSLNYILELCRRSGARFTMVDRSALDRMSPRNNQGVCARLGTVPRVALDTLLDIARHAPLPLILALDQIQDPGNVGTLARTLYAMGGGGIIMPKHNSAYLGADAMRASSGALPLLTISRVTNLGDALNECSLAGFRIYAAEAKNKGSESLFTARLELPAVLVLGNEEKGARPGVLRHVDQLLHIPLQRDFDSLNVAQAGAMLIAQFSAADALSGS
ncbi:MAG: RNA methyltransferase [Desulfovibrionaceae bacterium]|nr:RNA methyltransferase [Desulfovibrionaceae bacterium]